MYDFKSKTEKQISQSLIYLGEISESIDIIFSIKDKKEELFWLVKNKKIISIEKDQTQKKTNQKLYQYNISKDLWIQYLEKKLNLDDLMFGGHITIIQGKNAYSSLFHKLMRNLNNKNNLKLIKKYEERKLLDEILIHHKNKTYKIKKHCPHQFYPLDGAKIIDDIITCPAHGWKFNIKTGICLKGDKSKKIK